MFERKNEITKEKIKDRLPQAREMEVIWEHADDITRAYLKGCIATAQALAGKKAG